MENVTNKETLNLLDLLSETDSDVSDLVFTPQRKKKVKRRHRSSTAVKVKHSSFCGCKRSQMRVTSLWIAAILITLWLMALSWLAVILYGEIGKMDTSIKSIPLRPPTKKMKKRKELDALAPPHSVSRRSTGKRSSQELLSDSSDECSEFWNVSTRGPRKSRHRNNQSCPGLMRACSAFLACAAILGTASLIWLFIDVRQQLTNLRSELNQVIEGSEELPDAIQKCDSTSKQLQKNQTNIFIQLSNLKVQLNNFTEQITAIQRGLQEVQASFRAEPELASLPSDFKSLQNSVGKVGSQISDLKPTVAALKEANKILLDKQKIMQENISSLQTSLLGLTNATQKPQLLSTNETNVKIEDLKTTVSQLAKNLSIINQNLTARIDWAREEQAKDHGNLSVLEDKAENLRTKVETLRDESVTIHKQISELQSTDTEYNKTIGKLQQNYSTLQNSKAIQNEQAIPTLNSFEKKIIPESSATKKISTETDQRNQAGEKMAMEGNLSINRSKRSNLNHQ